MREYEPRSFKEGAALVLLFIALCLSVYTAMKYGGWNWIVTALVVPMVLYSMWRVGGWEE